MTDKITYIVVFIVLLQVLLCNGQSPPLSKLMLIGGELDEKNDAIIETMYNEAPFLAGHTPSTSKFIKVCTVTAASEDPEDSRTYYDELFKSYTSDKFNVETYWVPVDLKHIENNKDPQVISNIQQCNIIFFGGGDQSRLNTCFFENPKGSREDSPVLAQIRKLFLNSTVLIAGTSAGTTIQQGNHEMVSGGESYYAVRNGAFPFVDDKHPDNLSYDPEGGFGFFTLGVLDTHFSERGRQGRVIRLASHMKLPLAFGVDENTALYVQSDNNPATETAFCKVVTSNGNGVHLFNLTGSTAMGQGPDWSIYNLTNSYYTPDDEIIITVDKRSWATRKAVQFAKWKTSLKGRESYDKPLTSKDIFSSPESDSDEAKRKRPREFTLVGQSVVDAKHGTESVCQTWENDPTFTVRFASGPNTVGMQGYNLRKISYVSYDNELVSIYK